MSWGVEGVSVAYGLAQALDDVTLDLESGRIAVVVGGDGAGKTTLCRTIVGLEQVGAGKVKRPERTCFQPESSGVWGDLTVLENLQFVARGYRLPIDHSRSR
ncbi:MAG: ATP-binding cassette domain-containing protein, partial [Actinomycetota bacterium]